MENYEEIPGLPADRVMECVDGCDAEVDLECPGEQASSKDGQIQLHNPHLKHLKSDHLYHLALSTATHDLKEMFGDLKFICMGGTPTRMEQFARFAKQSLGVKLPTGSDLYDISHYSYRYSMYKVGPVLSVSHGMGAPSLSILLHEIFKLMHYAECKDVVLMRIGTSGGIGIPPGSVVVSDATVSGALREELEIYILGELVVRPAVLDTKLAQDIVSIGRKWEPKLNIVTGKTMCTHDFYEGQGRLDGAFCHYTEKMKFDFLERLRSINVVNIEMEATLFAAMCHHAGVKGAIICTTLVDRMKVDQVTVPKSVTLEWQERPQRVAIHYIKHVLGLDNGA